MMKMRYIDYYRSPLGKIILTADDMGINGLYFENQKHLESYLKGEYEEKDMPVFEEARRWLDIYFSGKEPKIKLPLHFVGTDFQKEVWEILCTIPYGKTLTYGDIARILAKRRSMEKMSAQAVGAAVGRNKISIIVPCHRVIGAGGELVGYAGGLDRKIALLKSENAFVKV